MAKPLEITMITGHLKADIVTLLAECARTLPGFLFADVRATIGEYKEALAENMTLRATSDDYGMSCGVRVIAEKSGMNAPGYDGRPIGPEEFKNLLHILKEMLETAYRRARVNADEKAKTKSSYPSLGKTLWNTELQFPEWPTAPVVVDAQYIIDSREYTMENLKHLTQDASLVFQDGKDKINYSVVRAYSGMIREFYGNSRGVSIEQNFAMSQGMVYVVSGDVTIYDVLGHQRGPEIFLSGVHEPPYVSYRALSEFAREIMEDALVLRDAPVCPTTEKEVDVVTEPHYNSLLVHEIVGHPTELDRGLKMETAYAGRTWLLKDPANTMLGKQIGSRILNAYSDPSLPGYGHYDYDHEGTPARRVDHIKKGVFTGFMNSVQTSTLFGGEPNGHWKATDSMLVPLIRMSTTVFAKGYSDPKELVQEVSNGYFLSGHSTPSIAESRENFRISARKVYKIERGELTKLYKRGGMSADSRTFFMNVNGVGTDFLIYPIPNCGKGQPMQAKKLGNGGPTLRSRARITGGE